MNARGADMRKILIVVDMQNDFIDGSLGTKEAVAIVPDVILTREQMFMPQETYIRRITWRHRKGNTCR